MQIKVQQNFNSLSVHPEFHSSSFVLNKKLIVHKKYGKVTLRHETFEAKLDILNSVWLDEYT